MNLIKSLILFVSLLFILPVSANTQQATTKKAQVTVDPQLKRFNESLGLKFIGIELTHNDGKAMVHFNYLLENRAKRTIKKVHWVTTYLHDNQVILIQDVPVTLSKPLTPKQSIPLDFSLPWDNLPANAQQALSSQNSVLSAEYQAKQIEFSNGSKITVK